MTTRGIKGNLQQRDDDSVLIEIMKDVLDQLKILNMYMAEGFDEKITVEDLDNDD